MSVLGFDVILNDVKKQRVVVLYGGRSSEHEISLQSAASVIRNLDPERFEVIPVGIDKDGRWRLNDLSLIHEQKGKELPIFKNAPTVALQPFPASAGVAGQLVPLSGEGRAPKDVDVVFPVMHGTLCEDGSIQGLLELAGLPYVGAGVLASAVGMDKEVAKRLVAAAGLPIVPYLTLRKSASWRESLSALREGIRAQLGYPVFVKPANLGSSVGVTKVKSEADLERALASAFEYDLKVLIEKAIDAREIEFSVLENAENPLKPLCSVPGEIEPTHEFYSYEAKYLDDQGAKLLIPAQLDDRQKHEGRRIAMGAFLALECDGMARVDLFLDRVSGAFYFNEVNTIPGFTSISMYPKLWEASGVPYKDLLTRLVDLAVDRHRRKSALKRDWK